MNHTLTPAPRPVALHLAPLALAMLLAGCGGGNTPSGDTATPEETGRARALAVVADSGTALTPVVATASGSERADLSAAAAAIDHDENTRWSSAFSDDQFLVLDFGTSVAINRVRIDWERAHATQYLLQVSKDGSNVDHA